MYFCDYITCQALGDGLGGSILILFPSVSLNSQTNTSCSQRMIIDNEKTLLSIERGGVCAMLVGVDGRLCSICGACRQWWMLNGFF